MRIKYLFFNFILLFISFFYTPTKGSSLYIPFKVNADGFFINPTNISISQKIPFIAGVNLGPTIPGYAPGELAMSYDDYLRFFTYTKDLGANTIRVNQLLPPQFYKAILDFNFAQQEAGEPPLWYFQGIYGPEEELDTFNPDAESVPTAWTDTVVDRMKINIENTVRGVHGDGIITYKFGEEGNYIYNTGDYLLGYLIGYEWSVYSVRHTDIHDPDKNKYNGTYFITKDDLSSPFEAWLAMLCDLVAENSVSFGYQHPISFINTISLDPIIAPMDPRYPSSEDDWAVVDASHIKPTSNFTAGYFVNFAAYAFSPHFLRYSYKDFNISNEEWGLDPNITDPFEGHLYRLRHYFNNYSTIITASGYPTAWGLANTGYNGRDRGHLSEEQQAEILSSVITISSNLNYQGILIMELLDEWFRPTWNTRDLSYSPKSWYDVITADQSYGVVGVVPLSPIKIDGDTSDWDYLPSNTAYYPFQDIKITNDASFLYLMFSLHNQFTLTDELWIGFDTFPDSGSTRCNLSPHIKFSRKMDFIVHINLYRNTARVYVNSANNYFLRRWGEALGFIDDAETLLDSTLGIFNEWQLLVKSSTMIPNFNEDSELVGYTELSPEFFYPGRLKRGISNRNDSNYHNMASWNLFGNSLEIRIPWLLIGFSDPSLAVLFDIKGTNNDLKVEFFDTRGLYFEAILNEGGLFQANPPIYYEWPLWELLCYEEYYKKSFFEVRNLFHNFTNIPTSDSFNYSLYSTSAYVHCPASPWKPVFVDPPYWNLVTTIHTFIIISVLFFISFMLFVAGILGQIFAYCQQRKASQNTRKGQNVKVKGNEILRAFNSALFMAFALPIGLTFLFKSYTTDLTLLDMLYDFGRPDERITDTSIYFIYLFFITWDGWILILYSLCFRWNAKYDVQKKLFEKKLAGNQKSMELFNRSSSSSDSASDSESANTSWSESESYTGDSYDSYTGDSYDSYTGDSYDSYTGSSSGSESGSYTGSSYTSSDNDSDSHSDSDASNHPLQTVKSSYEKSESQSESQSESESGSYTGSSEASTSGESTSEASSSDNDSDSLSDSVASDHPLQTAKSDESSSEESISESDSYSGSSEASSSDNDSDSQSDSDASDHPPSISSKQLPPVPSKQLPPVPSKQLPPVPSKQLPPVPSKQLPPVPSNQPNQISKSDESSGSTSESTSSDNDSDSQSNSVVYDHPDIAPKPLPSIPPVASNKPNQISKSDESSGSASESTSSDNDSDSQSNSVASVDRNDNDSGDSYSNSDDESASQSNSALDKSIPPASDQLLPVPKEKSPKTESKKKYRGHAFIIACHNSSDKIEATVECILQHQEPWQIFVGDNGSTELETLKTKDLCTLMSERYQRKHPFYLGEHIHFGTIREGSKTVAQFAAVYALHTSQENEVDLVTFIDDDTLVPVTWSEAKVMKIFEDDPSVACLSYPLKASDHQTSVLPLMQCVEYLTCDFVKIANAKVTTGLFASGAFATWRTDIVLDVLLRHDTMHHGDDLQQGLIMHTLCHKPYILDPEKYHNGGGTNGPYKMAMSEDIMVQTDVPVCWVHARDVMPPFVRRRLAKTTLVCPCGEPSLFAQRAKGWDVSRQRFLVKYLEVVFSSVGLPFWRAIWIRMMCIYDALLIANDWISVTILLILFFSSSNVRLTQFIVHGLLMGWAWQILAFMTFDLLVLYRGGLFVPIEAIVPYPFFYKIPTLLFMKTYAMFYNLLYYLPFHRNKPLIKTRLRQQNDGLANEVIDAFPEVNNDDDDIDEDDLNFSELDTQCNFNSGAHILMRMSSLSQNKRDSESFIEMSETIGAPKATATLQRLQSRCHAPVNTSRAESLEFGGCEIMEVIEEEDEDDEEEEEIAFFSTTDIKEEKLEESSEEESGDGGGSDYYSDEEKEVNCAPAATPRQTHQKQQMQEKMFHQANNIRILQQELTKHMNMSMDKLKKVTEKQDTYSEMNSCMEKLKKHVVEQQTKKKDKDEAKIKAEETAKIKAEGEARRIKEALMKVVEDEAIEKAFEGTISNIIEETIQKIIDEEARLKAEEKARLKAIQEEKINKAIENRFNAHFSQNISENENENVSSDTFTPEEEVIIKAAVKEKIKIEEAILKAEEDTINKTIEEAIEKAVEEAIEKALKEARLKAEEEARLKAMEEALHKAEEETINKTIEEAIEKAVAEARLKAIEEETILKAEEETINKTIEKAVAEARRKAEEEARLIAEEEARLKAMEEALHKAEEDVIQKTIEEAIEKAVAEARLKSIEDEAKREEARVKAIEDAKINEAIEKRVKEHYSPKVEL